MLSKLKTKDLPKIRFSEFDDKWVTSKLSEISERITKKNTDNKITETFTNSAVQGIVSQRDFFDKDISNESNIDKYYIVEPDDFIYNPRISNSAPVGPIRRNNLGRIGIMSPLYFVFRNKYLDDTFLEYYFLSNRWHKHMYKYGNTGARADRFAIKISDLSKMEINHPSINEQEKIKKLFLTLDDLILAQEKQVKNLEQYKQAMLQKMFPQIGGNIPKLRFEGFNDDWKEEKLGDLLQYEQPTKYLVDTDNYDDSYKIPVLTAGQKFILGYTNETEGIYDKGEIILFDDFTTATQFVDFPFKVKSSATKFLTPIDNNNIHFLYETLNLVQYPTEDHKRYWISEFSTLKVLVPSFEEQKLIGEFFKKIDNQIDAQKEKVEEYKLLKQGLLQKMFV